MARILNHSVQHSYYFSNGYSIGLIYLKGNEVTPRCQLYRQYFSEKLGLMN
ncbi:AAA-like domain-containing protein [Anabaena subtropica FACHB-260]|uniref:AAA-like domain-containing protein n=1 Tax=Anabaena subtropica FACHB-260 TaxID=2692884 RepID=A0ABR8CKH5_9NOST|nr:AAA-like domain-containing protein [Anabaena subtropica FACHB-260]